MSVFCLQLSLLPKANVGGIPCESKGGLDAQDSAKWHRLFSVLGHESRARSTLIKP